MIEANRQRIYISLVLNVKARDSHVWSLSSPLSPGEEVTKCLHVTQLGHTEQPSRPSNGLTRAKHTQLPVIKNLQLVQGKGRRALRGREEWGQIRIESQFE